MIATVEMQLFVGLAVVLGTVFVALLCDYMKGHNEQLRENNVAYRVRQQEWERFGLVQSIARLQALISVPATETPQTTAASPEKSAPEADSRAWATKEELEGLAGRAAKIRARAESPAEVKQPAAKLAPAASATQFGEPAERTENKFKLIRMDAPAAKTGSEEPDQETETLAQQEPAKEIEFPAGRHSAATLDKLAASNQLFSGVAILFGATDYETAKNQVPSEEINTAFLELQEEIESLAEQADFRCRYSENEFILLAPGLADAAAQRRIFQASERLWDFQIRSLGRLPMMFSWGGYEAQNQTIAEALQSVRERFEQTKNNREARASVVNG